MILIANNLHGLFHGLVSLELRGDKMFTEKRMKYAGDNEFYSELLMLIDHLSCQHGLLILQLTGLGAHLSLM